MPFLPSIDRISDSLIVSPLTGTALTINGAPSSIGLTINPNSVTPGNLTQWNNSKIGRAHV
mgnify:CR=1 FL=1